MFFVLPYASILSASAAFFDDHLIVLQYRYCRFHPYGTGSEQKY
jgi:hypothetical protein